MNKIILTGLIAVSLLTSCSKEEGIKPQTTITNTIENAQRISMVVNGSSSYAVVTHSSNGNLILDDSEHNTWEYSLTIGETFTVTSQEPNGNTTNPTIFVYVDSTLIHTHSAVDSTGKITYTYTK